MSGILPKGWVQTNLGTVSTHPQYGWTCSSTKIGSLKLLRTTDISSGKVDWDNVPYCSEVPDQIEKFVLGKNDIVVSRAGSIGVSFCLSESDLEYKAVFASYLIRFRPLIPATFVYYYLKSSAYWQFISASQLGIAVPNVNASKLAELPLPLPPLTEQKRIIAKLDAIMPRIHSVKERLEKIPAILKSFRQSVLTAAVTGKLTEKWREEHPDVESAEELLESIFKAKQALFKQNGVSKSKIVDESDIFFSTPVNWKWCRLSEITLKMSTGPFGTMLHKSDYIDNGIPIINPTNIIGEKIIASDKITISKSKYEELLRYSLKENNIVLARRGDLSKCGIVRKEQSNWLCGTGSFFLEVAISPVYFRLFYVSNYCQAPLNEDSIGSTMSNLNQSVLSNIAFPLPPLDEQKEIVRQVDKLFALADKVEEYYRKARARVDALAQSVLAKAFRGELVPQDPDDEPAEKLLQRIKEEKTKMEAELKTVSRSARGTRRNGAKTQRAGAEEKQASEP